MDRQKLINTIFKAEGEVLHIYKDSEGYDTIGIGHLIKPGEHERFKNGITHQQALDLLDEDLDRAIKDVVRTFPWFSQLDEVRQRVIAEMSFNLGIKRLVKFKNTCQNIARGAYKQAAKDMLDSLWAKQVKGRAVRLAQMMATGEDWP